MFGPGGKICNHAAILKLKKEFLSITTYSEPKNTIQLMQTGNVGVSKLNIKKNYETKLLDTKDRNQVDTILLLFEVEICCNIQVCGGWPHLRCNLDGGWNSLYFLECPDK